MNRFRVGLSGDFRNADGSAAFPSFDLAPLNDDPRIFWDYVPVQDGRIAAADMVGIDALILLGARFDADSFPGDGRLSLIARFGVGYDTVDVAACDANSTGLIITPSGVQRPVAVAILTFILALAGKLMIKDRLARGGPDGWAQRNAHMGVGLMGRTLGSIGLGNIGAESFRMAAPLGMNFIAHDPYADPALAVELGVRLVSLEEVFRSSDFVSVTCPLNDQTRGLVNAERLALMKPTAFLINTARGPIVDESALIATLTGQQIAGAGLDVFAEEPNSSDNPLYALPNVIATPHSLCWTDQCFAGMGAADIQAVQAVMAGAIPDGIVNRSITDDPAWRAKLALFAER